MSFAISNSEVDTYNTCERKWYYAFGLGLRPKKRSEALSYGILGHKALEAFYRTLIATRSIEESKYQGTKVVGDYLARNFSGEAKQVSEDAKIAKMVGARFKEYIDYYDHNEWKPLEVESTFVKREISPGIDYYMTADLIAEVHKGPYRGEIVVTDHKWCYNFWTDMEVTMHPQIPKYVDALRDNDLPIKRGFINQIRYRDDARSIFQRREVEPTEAAIKTIRFEEAKAVREIEAVTRQGMAEAATVVRRKMQRRVCKDCAFNLICRMEMNGQDISETITVLYEPNDYGYRE